MADNEFIGPLTAKQELLAIQKLLEQGHVLSKNEEERMDDLVKTMEKSYKAEEKSRKSQKELKALMEKSESTKRVTEKLQKERAEEASRNEGENQSALNELVSVTNSMFGITKTKELADKRKAKKLDKETERELLGIEQISMPTDVSDWMGAIVGAITAFVGGVAAGIAETVALLIGSKNVKRLTKVLKSFSSALGKIVEVFKGGIKLLGETKAGGKLFETFKVFSGKLKSFFNFITQPLKQMSLLMGEVKAVTKFAEPFMKFFSAFKGVFQALGKFVGRLLIPLFATIEAITTAIDFFKNTEGNMFQKIIGAFVGAITGVVDFLVVSVLEMGKKLLSWVAGKFGLTGIEEFLDSFDLSKMFKEGMQMIVNMIIHPIDTAMALVEGIGAFLDGMIGDLDEKVITPVMNGIGKFLSDMGKAIASIIHMMIDGVVKLGTALPGFFAKFFTDMFNVVMFIPKQIFEVLKGAVAWVLDAIGIDSFSDFIDDPLGSVLKIIYTPYTLLKQAVAWVLSKLGFDDVAADLKAFNIGDAIKSVILSPIQSLKKAVSFVMEKLGFGADGTGEGDIAAAEGEESTILSTILKIITAPYRLLGKAVDFVLGKMGFDSLKEYIPDVGSFLKSAGDMVGSLIKDSINFIKDKLMFWKKKSQDNDEMSAVSGQESVSELDDMGILSNTGKYNPMDAKIEPEAIKNLSMSQLDQIAAEYPDKGGYKGMHDQIRTEKARRLKPQTTQGDLGTALDASSVAPAPPEYTGPMVTATGQQAAQLSGEMSIEQQSLNNAKSQQASGGSSNTNVVSAPSTTNSSVTNNFTSSKQPTSQDYTDYNMSFSATGNSR